MLPLPLLVSLGIAQNNTNSACSLSAGSLRSGNLSFIHYSVTGIVYRQHSLFLKEVCKLLELLGKVYKHGVCGPILPGNVQSQQNSGEPF
jgi:hypothetical protein